MLATVWVKIMVLGSPRMIEFQPEKTIGALRAYLRLHEKDQVKLGDRVLSNDETIEACGVGQKPTVGAEMTAGGGREVPFLRVIHFVDARLQGETTWTLVDGPKI